MDNDEVNYQQEPQQQYPPYQRRRKKRRRIFDWLQAGRQIAQIVRFAYPALGFAIVGIVLSLIIYVFFFANNSSIGTSRFDPVPETPAEPDTGVLFPGITLVVISYGEDTGIINEVANGENIVYKITVTYDIKLLGFPISTLVVSDIIPPITKYVSSSPECTLNTKPVTYVECGFQDPPPDVFTGTEVFEIIVTPTMDDVYIYNTVKIRKVGSPVLGAQTSSPTNCFTHTRQGEPCMYSKENLYDLLLSLDPQNANYWFYQIIPCESSYDPESNGKTTTGLPTLGLLQLVKGENPERIPPWEEQIKNAVEYNKTVLGESFAYWSCAK